jgi:hypothetical protein
VNQWTTTFLVGLIALALFRVAAAEPLEDGLAAYQRGDYAAAIGYWRPLASELRGVLGLKSDEDQPEEDVA